MNPAVLPTFSIIYETENLASLKLENIYPSLDSLVGQDLPVTEANEFFIMDSGDVPDQTLKDLCAKYPWIQTRKIDPDLGYYEAKMKGAGMVTGEILLLCDSDCIYEKNWLRNILTFFAEHKEASIVAGETSTRIQNPYEMAIAMSYFFPRYTGKKEAYEEAHYFCNNVGFLRQFLLNNPIPPALPFFRGNCLVHAFSLHYLEGKKIWKHPGARALHEPPEIKFSFWRHLLLGRDRVLRKKMLAELAEKAGKPGVGSQTKGSWWVRVLKVFEIPQIFSVLKENPWRWLLLPFALPIALLLSLLFHLGCLITHFNQDYLLEEYNRYEKKRKGV